MQRSCNQKGNKGIVVKGFQLQGGSWLLPQFLRVAGVDPTDDIIDAIHHRETRTFPTALPDPQPPLYQCSSTNRERTVSSHKTRPTVKGLSNADPDYYPEKVIFKKK